ncbi:MAG: STAS/SEC14 domain-containing protein [Planctomycetes bacterium]|nr:STAS/SEC14 domain-containing protein [Planctomycetota bacterium]
MIRFLPEDAGRTIALRVTGKLTHADYGERLSPRLEQALREPGKLIFLGVLGPDYEGITAHALWDELRLDIAHRKDFERAAIVTDDWMVRTAVRLFGPLFSGEVRLFHVEQQQEAARWLGLRAASAGVDTAKGDGEQAAGG